MSLSRHSKSRYRTNNWKQYNAALKARGSLTFWLDKCMSWFAAISGKRGRSPQFSDTATQFCLSIKNLFGLGLRQTVGVVQSLLALSGLPWPVPDFSTLCRRQRSLDVQVAYRLSSDRLNLLLDSTGIKFLGGQWCKLHIGIDAQMLQVRVICVTSNNVSDAVVPHLLAQLPADESLLSVTGDGAYDTQTVYAAVMERNAMPIIPARKNARMRKGAAFVHRNAAIAACRRLGRGLWKRWSGYHRRSLVETKMHCIKRLGERVMSRTFERQVNELHIRAAILNRFTELGCPQTAAVA